MDFEGKLLFFTLGLLRRPLAFSQPVNKLRVILALIDASKHRVPSDPVVILACPDLPTHVGVLTKAKVCIEELTVGWFRLKFASVLEISVLDPIHYCENVLLEGALTFKFVILSQFARQISLFYEELDRLVDVQLQELNYRRLHERSNRVTAAN